MTTQEALDQIIKHFMAPEAKLAYDPGRKQCAYRTPNGDACAVGCLFPDEMYHYEFEGHSGRMFADIYATGMTDESPDMTSAGLDAASLVGKYLTDVDTQFICDVQGAHDSAVYDGGKDAFFLELKNIAKKYNLKMPTVVHQCDGDEHECGC